MDAIETVKALIAEWRKAGGFFVALDLLFTADCIYEVVGVPASNGPEAIRAFMLDFAKMYPFASIDVELRSIAVNDDLVLTERVDQFRDCDGKELLSIPLMGLFRVRKGQICECRNYFDTFPFRDW